MVLDRKRKQTGLGAAGDAVSLAVELRETGETIGDAVLILTSVEDQQGEVGYLIDPDHQGRGYATEATVALLEIAFGEVELHRVCGRFEPRNIASGRVLERAGMRREATLVENGWIRGEWQSEGICAVLRREWLERRRQADT
jgi:RimJ/RimL family protein N-acetyltransferase